MLTAILAGVVLIREGIVESDSHNFESAGLSRALMVVGVGCIAIGTLVLPLVLWLSLSGSYEITPEELIVRFGPFRQRYQLSSIAEANATTMPLGPLGLGLGTSPDWDCVSIKFRPDGRFTPWPLVICPDNKAEFLRELAERVPGLGGRDEGTQKDSTRLDSLDHGRSSLPPIES
jgi:hypothetical protein